MIRYVKPILKILGLAAFLALPGCAAVLDLDDALAIAPYHIEDKKLGSTPILSGSDRFSKSAASIRKTRRLETHEAQPRAG